MITSSEVRTSQIAALKPGEELTFTGCGRDGIPWKASVTREASVRGGQLGVQEFIVDTCWSGDGAGVECHNLTIRRTFTQASYANNYLLTNC